MDDIKVISKALAGAEKTVLIGFPVADSSGVLLSNTSSNRWSLNRSERSRAALSPVTLMTRGVINAPYASMRRTTLPQSYQMFPSTR